MRQVCCGIMKMSGYPTTIVKQRRESAAWKGVSRDLDLEQRYRAVMKEYIGKGYACKLSPEEADHLSKKGGSKHNCWPVTIGGTGLKSTYQLCRRDPSGNRKKGTFTSETSFWWLMIMLQGTSGPWDESKTCLPERMDWWGLWKCGWREQYLNLNDQWPSCSY